MKYQTAAIVLAAGRGSRMHSAIQKQYLSLRGKPVLFYSLQAFENSFVDEIVLVTGRDEIEYCRSEIVERYGLHKVKHIVEGGAERYHSVFHGLQALTRCDYVLIHDGARPFVTQKMLHRIYEAVRLDRACAAGMPVKDTIKVSDEDGYAQDTPRRDRLWTVQTPQAFEFSLIRSAYDSFLRQEAELSARGIRVTDDAMVAERFSDVRVRLVEGSYRNLKITTPEDLLIAEALLAEESAETERPERDERKL